MLLTRLGVAYSHANLYSGAYLLVQRAGGRVCVITISSNTSTGLMFPDRRPVSSLRCLRADSTLAVTLPRTHPPTVHPMTRLIEWIWSLTV